MAVAEGDLAQQEMLFELGPFFAAGGAQLAVLALLAAAFDEGFSTVFARCSTARAAW